MARILVIDDDDVAAEVYTSLLQTFGHETSFVTSSKEAFAHLASARPDLVILDIMMPDMNGLDLLRKLKSDKENTGLRIVIFSAMDETDWRERAAIAGACDYWIKGGFDFGELEERVASCLAGANQSPVHAQAV